MGNARNIINEFVDDVVKDTTKTLNNVSEYIAEKAADDWERIANSVMDDYYATKTLGYYERTDSMRNIVQRVFEKNNGRYTAGVMFDVSRMDHGNMPKFSEFAIFDNFMYGQHGNEDYTVPTTREVIQRNIAFTTPYARIVMDKYYQNYNNQLDKYFNIAICKFGK